MASDELPEADAELILPLHSCLDARRHMLMRKCRRVAWVYGDPDYSTFRYRAFNMVDAVNRSAQSGISASWFWHDEVEQLDEVIRHCEAMVLTRVSYDSRLNHLAAVARRHGVRLYFDCDDLVFDIDYVPLVMESLAVDCRERDNWDRWFAYVGRLQATMRLCDAGITTNSFLQQRMLHAMGGRPVSVVPNYLNRGQQHYAQQLFDARMARDASARLNETVTVGYFSGSPSHNLDFAVAAPALARLLATEPDVRLRIVGYLDRLGPLEPFRERIEFFPHMNYIALQKAIAEVDINIAPLQDNVFTNCKSELKFFEAAVVGSWTIATPTYTFRAAIDDGCTGRLARAHEWDDALAEATHLARSEDRFRDHARHGAMLAVDRYGWDVWTPEIMKATGMSQ